MPIRLLTVALLVLLTGCTSETKLAMCPGVTVLVDTATLPVMTSDKATDPADILYTAQIVNADGNCDIHKYDKQVEAGVDIHFRAARAKAGDAAGYKIPYFVAITTEGRVLAKQEFWVQFGFEQGQAVADFNDSVNSLTLTVGRDKRAADYGIVVGFQLTKAQLAMNRKVGRFAP
ncbi:MAG TPA: hypothetical protein VLV55_09230 [Rhizomicrobium sp.]|nr:hypothetical protein [Rhizomicrobium sp.]